MLTSEEVNVVKQYSNEIVTNIRNGKIKETWDINKRINVLVLLCSKRCVDIFTIVHKRFLCR